MPYLSFSFLLLVATALGADVSHNYKVFYCVHHKAECVSPDNPKAMSREDALLIMKAVVAEKDAFLGFVDSKDVTLQFYTEEPHKIWVEIPAPARKGSFGALLTDAKAFAVIRNLSGDLEGEKKALGLKFRPW